MASLFSDFLTALGVRHTEDYSDSQFAAMPFQSMFGLANLLQQYGVGSTGIKVPEQSRSGALSALSVPFLADTPDGFAIVTQVQADKVTYLTQQRQFTVPALEFADAWNGIALIAAKDAGSAEPDYGRHYIDQLAKGVKRWTVRILAGLLLLFGMYATGLYSHWAAWPLLVFDCLGILLSLMLVQKSLGIKNKAADAVCSTLEEGGCDELAKSKASSFMGIFKWSEVGLAYFSVSLIAMLLYPRALPALAAINILCLPYTIWSIVYQKFIGKVWCTLCVSVQITLWALFAFYLAGGWTQMIRLDTGEFWIIFGTLAASYITVMLALNAIDNALLKLLKQ